MAHVSGVRRGMALSNVGNEALADYIRHNRFLGPGPDPWLQVRAQARVHARARHPEQPLRQRVACCQRANPCLPLLACSAQASAALSAERMPGLGLN